MAARIYRAAASHIMGYLYLELGGFFGSAVECFRRGGLEKAGPEKYPHLSKLVPSLSAWDPEREFEASLRRLLAGFHRDMNRDSDQVAREMLLDDI